MPDALLLSRSLYVNLTDMGILMSKLLDKEGARWEVQPMQTVIEL